MQIIVPGKALNEEVNAANVVKLFPYLKDRIDAIQEIKRMEYDMARISNFGRLLLNKHGSKMRRIGSFPMHVLDEATLAYGDDFLHNTEKLHKFFRANPEYSFIYGR